MYRLNFLRICFALALMVLICPALMAAEDEQSLSEDPAVIQPADQAIDAKPLDAKSEEPKPAEKTSTGLAPGVMVTIEPDHNISEAVSQHDVVELLAEDPGYDWAKDVTFLHEVWALQFKFKPVRMIWVDVPQPSGMMQRKLIWYMVYAITNTGKVMVPVKEAALPYENELSDKKKIHEIKSVDKPIHFVPEFLLEGHNRMKYGEGFTKVYPDRVIPVAVGSIQSREGKEHKLLTSVQICRDVAVDETVWGVATWEDIDPKIVRFSIYVIGLTNAYRWKDTPGEYKPGDPLGTGRQLLRKTLKLNFWRPGDEYFEHEEEIRYGIPGRVDSEWVYR